jgi:hypothetical protein
LHSVFQQAGSRNRAGLFFGGLRGEATTLTQAIRFAHYKPLFLKSIRTGFYDVSEGLLMALPAAN